MTSVNLRARLLGGAALGLAMTMMAAQPAQADSVCAPGGTPVLPPPVISVACTDVNGNGQSEANSTAGPFSVLFVGPTAVLDWSGSPQAAVTTGYIESTTAGRGVLNFVTDQAFTYTGTGSTLVGQATATGAITLGITAPSVTMTTGTLTALGAGSTALSVTSNGGAGSGGIATVVDGDILSAAGPAILLNATNAAGTGNVVLTSTVGNDITSGAGAAVNISTAGTGAISATTAGSVTADAGNAINILSSNAAGGAISVSTTNAIRASGGDGIVVNTAGSGNVTINTANGINSAAGGPGTLQNGIVVASTGTGNIAVSHSVGAIGGFGDVALGTGISTTINNVASAGTISIATASGVIVSGDSIVASTNGTGAVSINTTGGLTLSNTARGISATSTSGAITVNAGTVTSGGGDGIRANSTTGALTITNGVINATGGAGVNGFSLTGNIIANVNGSITSTGQGLLLESNGTKTINVAAGTTVNSTGNADIEVGDSGTTLITNSGTIGANTFGTAILATNLVQGAVTTNNLAGGTINGRLNLTDSADSFANTGIFNTQGTTDFAAGADVLTNNSAGVINILGATSFTGLETFTQNGRINLGANVLTLSGTPFTNGTTGYIDTSGSASILGVTSLSNAGTLDLAPGIFTVPAVVFTNTGVILADEGVSSITGQTSFANSGTIDLQDGAVGDQLTINSTFAGSGLSNLLIDFDDTTADSLVTLAASGSTTVNANNLSVGLINVGGVLVADTTATTANAFVLGTVTGNVSPLVDFGLVQVGTDFFLTSIPNASAFNPLVVPGFATDLWYQSANEIFAETVKPASTVGFSFWGEGYASRDKYGDDDDSVSIDGVEFGVDNEMKTKRYGLQGGIDYGFGGGRIGLTGGYGWAKANGNADADLKAKGWNLGIYGQFGGLTGFHGEFLLKHDRYDAEFRDGVFDGEKFDIRSTGIDGSLGYRFGMSAATLDLHGGLSHVRTKVDDINAFGFNYDIGKMTSTRGRAGVRAIFGGSLAPYVDATVYREFNGDGDVRLFDGGSTYNLDTNGRGTWVRLEAGLSGNDGPGPILAAWGDFGDRKGLGLRAGWRFGGGQVAEVLPPPPPPYIAPPPPPPPATQTCSDGSVILATDMCPPPPPPPPPPPEPERG